jgi:hypothetical protein
MNAHATLDGRTFSLGQWRLLASQNRRQLAG